nr:C4-type zinc ribbon domain-containing protein [Actinomycetota bacterium]
GQVSASRELQAMAADVESSRARTSELEDRILAVLDEREPLDATVSALEVQVASSTRAQEATQGRLAVSEAAIEGELNDLVVRRRELAAAVPPDLLASYDKLRSRLGGIGAARLVGNRCGGCHLTLPATELDRLRHAKDDAPVEFCDQCGRILVLS